MATSLYKCDLCNISAGDKITFESHNEGSKHKLALHKKNCEEKKTKCGVYVTGFLLSSNREAIVQVFAKYGTIVKYFFGNTNRYAIIQFENENTAKNVINTKIKFKGRELTVRPRILKSRTTENLQLSKNKKDINSEDNKKIRYILSSHADFDYLLEQFIKELQLPEHIRAMQYSQLCADLQFALSSKFPNCRAYPFGSTVTGLSFKHSDVDVYIEVLKSKLESSTIKKSADNIKLTSNLTILSKKLLNRTHLFSNVFAIPKAKTPIVKCIHISTGVSCDFNFKNMLGVCNSNLINFLLSMDSRLRPTMIIIKYWGKIHEVTGSGKMSNYCLVLLFIFYLQQCSNPILPSVNSLQQPQFAYMQEGWNGGFCMDQILVPQNQNNLSIPELLHDFFKFYSIFDYGLWVICPLSGHPIAKLDFVNITNLPPVMKNYVHALDTETEIKLDSVICVQDPFELTYNITGHLHARHLKDFQILCENSTNVCMGPSTKLLFNLFFVICKPKYSFTEVCTEDMCMFTIPFTPHMIHINIKTDEDKSKVLSKIWFNKLNDFLRSVLRKVFLFDVSVKLNVPCRKSLKIEGQTDIHDTDNIDVVIFHCSSTCNVWEARKSISKTFTEVSKVTNILEKEILLSEYIAYTLYKGETASESLVEFDLFFISKINPVEAKFQLKNIKSKKNCFKIMAQSLAYWLPIWFEKNIIEFSFRELHKNDSTDGKNDELGFQTKIKSGNENTEKSDKIQNDSVKIKTKI